MLLLPTYILEGNVTAFYSLFSLLVCYTIQPQHSPIALPFTIFQNKTVPIYPSIRQYRFYCNWPHYGLLQDF